MAQSKAGKALAQHWKSLEAPRVAHQHFKDGLITRRERDLKSLDAKKAGEREYQRDHVGRFASKGGSKVAGGHRGTHEQTRPLKLAGQKKAAKLAHQDRFERTRFENKMRSIEGRPQVTELPPEPKHFKSDPNVRFKKLNLDRAATKTGRGMFKWANQEEAKDAAKRKAAAKP